MNFPQDFIYELINSLWNGTPSTAGDPTTLLHSPICHYWLTQQQTQGVSRYFIVVIMPILQHPQVSFFWCKFPQYFTSHVQIVCDGKCSLRHLAIKSFRNKSLNVVLLQTGCCSAVVFFVTFLVFTKTISSHRRTDLLFTGKWKQKTCAQQLISHRKMYCKTSNISRTEYQRFNVFRLIMQLFLPNPLKPGVQVEDEDVVGAAPTGDAPTTSEWSTILLPTKVRLKLEVWQ